MRKLVSFLLIASGIAVFFYPSAIDFYFEYQQDKLIEAWDNNDPSLRAEASGNAESAQESYAKLDKVFVDYSSQPQEDVTVEDDQSKIKEKTDTEGVRMVTKPEAETQMASPTAEANSQTSRMLGILEISKISVKLPILAGATMQNLDVGAGHLSGTVFPGEGGNAAIAAHRSRSYGKMFNRLDELDSGDIISVRNKEQTIQYKVTSTQVVTPSDVSVLGSTGKDTETLTLITCTPIETATHRLIVKAERIN
ncbi:class D sortase [Mesobacillus harenae]|uniref:class D sortase n=1 Tax=Mesobacillus harenae TaxID=2213203 RepID=UPI001580D45F|nr:class D sortase [Mesobacillus harenae]